MNSSKANATPIMINIDFGRKKPASAKKRKCEKKKDVLPKGQMTLTQMPCMSPPLGRNLDEGSEVESVNLLPDSSDNTKNDFPLDDDVEKTNSLVLVPFVSKDEEETVVLPEVPTENVILPEVPMEEPSTEKNRVKERQKVAMEAA